VSSINRIFNVKPSPRDKKDFVYSSTFKLDRSVDLRSYDSPIEDQGTLGSCVSHAVTSAYENMLRSSYNDMTELSRLFLYYHTRLLENSVSYDSGVIYLRSAMKAGNKYGICREDFWDYTISEFTFKPSEESYADALTRKIINYESVTNVTDIIDLLVKLKPVVIGFKVYPSFMGVNIDNSTIPIPSVTESSLGGHAVSIVGYIPEKQHFIIKNSFGASWGEAGYAYMPIEYVRLFAFDKWAFDISPQLINK